MVKKRQAAVLGIEVSPGENQWCTWFVGLEKFAWAGFGVRVNHAMQKDGKAHRVWGPTLPECVAYSVGLTRGLADDGILDVSPMPETKEPGSPA